MCYILLLLLTTLFILAYFLFDGLLSPTVQLIGMFILGMLSYIVSSFNWNCDLNVQTFLIILFSLLLFGCGEFFSKRISMRLKKAKGCDLIDSRSLATSYYQIKPFWLISLTLLSAVVLVLDFKYTMELSIAAGNVYGISHMINFAYYAKTQLTGMPEEPQLLTFGLVISKVFAFYCVVIVIVAIKRKELFRHFSWVCLLPIAIYVCQALLAGGRTQLLRLIIQFVVTYLFISKSMPQKKKSKIKNVLIISLGIIGFFAAYKAYGIMRGSQFTDNDYLLSYPGSSIQALNVYLDSPNYSHAFGQETMVTIRAILNKLGFGVETYPLALETINWQNGSTNIYTALRRYIADYSYIGCLTIVFALGFLYGRLEKRVTKSKSLTMLVLYAIVLYPIIEFLFEERFLIGIISAGTVYEIFFIIFLRRIIKRQPISIKVYMNNKNGQFFPVDNYSA